MDIHPLPSLKPQAKLWVAKLFSVDAHCNPLDVTSTLKAYPRSTTNPAYMRNTQENCNPTVAYAEATVPASNF